MINDLIMISDAYEMGRSAKQLRGETVMKGRVSADSNDIVILHARMICLALTRQKDDEWGQDIYIHLPDGSKSLQRVLMDTQCTKGNWISYKLVKKLGMKRWMGPVDEPLNVRDYNGNSVDAEGVISFRWGGRNGTTIYDPVKCYVGNPGIDFDIIFGSEYIRKEKLASVNAERFLVTVQHEPANICEYVVVKLLSISRI